MVRLLGTKWAHEAWELHFAVREGVYFLDDYPVRVTHLAYTDDPEIQQALEVVVTGFLHRHMRRGAVPPHAMVIDWGRAHRISEGSDSKVVAACDRVNDTLLHGVGPAISNYF